MLSLNESHFLGLAEQLIKSKTGMARHHHVWMRMFSLKNSPKGVEVYTAQSGFIVLCESVQIHINSSAAVIAYLSKPMAHYTLAPPLEK